MGPRTKAGVSAGAGVAVGVALATVVLPQLASAFNPTGWGTFAVALVLGLLGAAVSLRTTRGGRAKVCFAVAGGVAVATVVLYFAMPRLMRQPRSVADQINAVLNRLIDHGSNHLVVNERLTLHPSDDPSWIVVVQNSPDAEQFEKDTESGRPANDPAPVSDELRIYDVENGWLTLKLDYRPVGHGTTARYWVTPAGAPASFDYDKTGFPEILAGYALRDAWDELLPFVVDWTGSQYQLLPMSSTPPTLPATGFTSTLVEDRQDWYQTRTRLRDAVKGAASVSTLSGYEIGAFAFVSSPQVRLLTGYLAGPPNRQATQLYELRSNQISENDFHLEPCFSGRPACQAPADEVDVKVPPDKLPDDSLLAGWKLVKAPFTPLVSVTTDDRLDCPGC